MNCSYFPGSIAGSPSGLGLFHPPASSLPSRAISRPTCPIDSALRRATDSGRASVCTPPVPRLGRQAVRDGGDPVARPGDEGDVPVAGRQVVAPRPGTERHRP